MSANILFVNTPVYVGGAEVSILTLAANLMPGAFSPLVATSGPGSFAERTRAMGLPLVTLDFPWFSRRRPWRYARSIFEIVQLIRRRNIDLVHTNCDHGLPYVRLACTIGRTPYVSHVRDRVRTWFEPAKLAALNHAAAVIVSSRAMAQECTRKGVTRTPVLTIYNPVEIETFRATDLTERDSTRASLGLPPGSPTIGIVGQIQPTKGHADFIQATLRIAEKNSEAHFVVVGQPPPVDEAQRLLATLRRQIGQTTVANRFHFTGYREDIPRLMRSLDILTVPSWTEPFGRVAVEGMAAGCAVIASDVDGLPEIITNGIDGLLVPPRDVDALEGTIERLIADPELRKRLAHAGRESAARFSVSQHVAQMQVLYDRILTGRPTSEVILSADEAARHHELSETGG